MAGKFNLPVVDYNVKLILILRIKNTKINKNSILTPKVWANHCHNENKDSNASKY